MISTTDIDHRVTMVYSQNRSTSTLLNSTYLLLIVEEFPLLNRLRSVLGSMLGFFSLYLKEYFFPIFQVKLYVYGTTPIPVEFLNL